MATAIGNQAEAVKKAIRDGKDMKEINKLYAAYAAAMQSGGYPAVPLKDFMH